MSDYRDFDNDDDDYFGDDDCEQYHDCDDDGVDIDYDYQPWPEPDPSLLKRVKRTINRLRWRWYAWRHRDTITDIPF